MVELLDMTITPTFEVDSANAFTKYPIIIILQLHKKV